MATKPSVITPAAATTPWMSASQVGGRSTPRSRITTIVKPPRAAKPRIIAAVCIGPSANRLPCEMP